MLDALTFLAGVVFAPTGASRPLCAGREGGAAVVAAFGIGIGFALFAFLAATPTAAATTRSGAGFTRQQATVSGFPRLCIARDEFADGDARRSIGIVHKVLCRQNEQVLRRGHA